jgi:uncharacterized protein with HEPN domain
MPFEDVGSSHLQDILDSIDAIERFVLGMNLESFARDEKTRAAVERKMLIISEAAIRLRENAEALCPDVPWRDIRGIGNWLRHQYDSVETEVVWNTIQDDLPPLRASVRRALNKLD